MAYQVWSVVFGEQPSASKWNILGTNDAGFNDGTAIGDNAILQRHLSDGIVSNAEMKSDTFLYEKLADVTLGSAGDSLSSGTFTARKYLKFIAFILNSGTVTTQLRFNNDSGNNYSFRYTIDNGVGSSGTSSNNVGNFSGSGNDPHTIIGEMANLTATQKLGFVKTVSGSTNPATAPSYVEFYVKWANTSVQITRIDIFNTGVGADLAIGSRLIVLGHD